LGLSSLLAEAAPARARRAALQILALLPVAGCALFQGALMLPQMSEDQAAAYGQYLGDQAAAVARTAVASGEMSMGALMDTAIAFEAIGMGKVPPLPSTLFDGSKVGAAILQMTINDIHYNLLVKGGFQGGKIGVNAQLVCMEIAMRLKTAYSELSHAQ
jgi:hypothetical protein